MESISLKTGFLAFTLVAFASLSGVLTACSNAQENGSTVSQNQSQAPANPTDMGGMKDMNHGSGMKSGNGMNPNMTMDLGPADANYDLRFIDAMTLHHQGAVSMAKDAQQKSQRPEIKKLADGIIKAQNKEIEQLKQWRKAWYPQVSSNPMVYHAEAGHMMPMPAQMQKQMMMDMNLGAADTQFDLRFINAMITHHEGALIMAEDALSKSNRPEIKKLAQDIILSQKAEVGQMQQWRQAWYKQ
ncbi:MAG: DUF305 domain-containing protein [Microcoleus vaginatus WJT46-NPBG5]|jgi:uncharacterized protein (DUF305 family)|nr:DUF305 domain-containing protein [Microcoleus vaginatus WJT46-NPBG5]